MPFDENRRPAKTLAEIPGLLGAISGALAGSVDLADVENFSASSISPQLTTMKEKQT